MKSKLARRVALMALGLGLIVPAAGCDLVEVLQPQPPQPSFGEQVDQITDSVLEIVQALQGMFDRAE